MTHPTRGKKKQTVAKHKEILVPGDAEAGNRHQVKKESMFGSTTGKYKSLYAAGNAFDKQIKSSRSIHGELDIYWTVTSTRYRA